VPKANFIENTQNKATYNNYEILTINPVLKIQMSSPWLKQKH